MKVLLIMVHGLEAGCLACYGNEWIQTPNLNRLAADGVVFDTHIADCPGARWARRALLTGMHAACTLGPSSSNPTPNCPSGFAALSQEGVHTAFVTDVAAQARGAADDGWGRIELLGRPGESKPSLKLCLERLLPILTGLGEREPLFINLELNCLRPPFVVPRRFRYYYDRLFKLETESSEEDAVQSKEPADTPGQRSAYAAAVTYLDLALGRLLQWLQDAGWLDRMLVLVTSDQGHGLGIRPATVRRLPALHEEDIHLPLLLRLPGREAAGKRISALTQPTDLLPTILAALASGPVHGQGGNLLPLINEAAADWRQQACSVKEYKSGRALSIRTSEWHFLMPPGADESPELTGARLYRKPEDRWEVNDVSQQHPEIVEELAALLRGFMENFRKTHAEG